MEQAEVVHKRNWLLSRLLWVSLFMGLIGNILTGMSAHVTTILLITGTALCTITTLLTWKRIWLKYIMYLVVLELAILTFQFLSSADSVVYYFMAYYSIALTALYQNYRPIAVSGVFGILFTNYFFFQKGDKLFPGTPTIGLLLLNVFIALVTIVLMVQAGFAEKSRKELETKHRETNEVKEQIEQLLQQVKESVQVLGVFGNHLFGNITVTKGITEEISTAFHEVASSAEAQIASVKDIVDSIEVVNVSVQSVANAAETMRDVSRTTSDITAQGNREMGILTQEMNTVNVNIDRTVQLMNELNNETQQVEAILQTINHIVEQTNLLALNASIEAARAGEEGRGFSVVANEVRLLAEHSLLSTKEIVAVLGNIQQKTKEATAQVHDGQAAVGKSQAVVERAEQIFRQITDNTDKVVQQANQVEGLIHELQDSSGVIVKEIEMIARTTEKTTDSIESILPSVEEQSKRVQDVVQSFDELEEQTNGLQQLTQKMAI